MIYSSCFDHLTNNHLSTIDCSNRHEQRVLFVVHRNYSTLIFLLCHSIQSNRLYVSRLAKTFVSFVFFSSTIFHRAVEHSSNFAHMSMYYDAYSRRSSCSIILNRCVPLTIVLFSYLENSSQSIDFIV
jgi:hypothetical protein